MNQREKKLEALGYPLDDVPSAAAIYRGIMIDGETAYCSGSLPLRGGRLLYPGKVPSDVSLEQAYEAAALCAANCLRTACRELGSLERIDRVLRVTGFVNSSPEFTDIHLVINGASQLLLDIFGDDQGLAARSAVGTAQLPLGSSVEVEMILKLHA